MRCCVPACKSSYNHILNVSFFNIPTDHRREAWLKKISTKVSKHDRICQFHFEDKYFKNEKKNRIYNFAIPTLYLDNDTSEIPSFFLATCPGKQQLHENEVISKKLLNVRARVYEYIAKFNEYDFIKFTEIHFNSTTSNFLKMQLLILKQESKDFRLSKIFLEFCLNIYFMGPKVYSFLSKNFHLYSKVALERSIYKWNISYGINDFMFDIFLTKVQIMPDVAKHCVICIDEMNLKSNCFYNVNKDEIVGFHNTSLKKTDEVASKVLIVMARGLYKNWKQPIAYFFVSESCSTSELHFIVTNVIQKAIGIGLVVHGFISHHGTNFIKLADELGITIEKNHFLIGNVKVLYLFDTLQLIRSTRNMFLTKSFQIKEGRTNFKFVSDFIKRDQMQTYRIMPEITLSHLNPQKYQKKRLKYAADIFHSRLAAGLNTYIALKALPPSAMATAIFISKINQLFDILNSSSLKSKKPLNRPIKLGKDQRQILILKDALIMFQTLQLFDKNTNIPNAINFIIGWQITIKSTIDLWEKQKTSCKYLCTAALNLNCLEHLFRSIKQGKGNLGNLTPIQFSRSFKTQFLLYFMKYSGGVKSTSDLNKITVKMDPIFRGLFNTNVERSLNEIFIPTPDYHNLNLPGNNHLKFVSIYFLRKCFDRHCCQKCFAELADQHKSKYYYVHPKLKEYDEKLIAFEKLLVASKKFVDAILTLDLVFSQTFPYVCSTDNVGIKMRTKLLQVNLDLSCKDFDVNYLISLFVRVRIFFTIKFGNHYLRALQRNKNTPRKLRILQNL